MEQIARVFNYRMGLGERTVWVSLFGKQEKGLSAVKLDVSLDVVGGSIPYNVDCNREVYIYRVGCARCCDT